MFYSNAAVLNFFFSHVFLWSVFCEGHEGTAYIPSLATVRTLPSHKIRDDPLPQHLSHNLNGFLLLFFSCFQVAALFFLPFSNHDRKLVEFNLLVVILQQEAAFGFAIARNNS